MLFSCWGFFNDTFICVGFGQEESGGFAAERMLRVEPCNLPIASSVCSALDSLWRAGTESWHRDASRSLLWVRRGELCLSCEKRRQEGGLEEKRVRAGSAVRLAGALKLSGRRRDEESKDGAAVWGKVWHFCVRVLKGAVQGR